MTQVSEILAALPSVSGANSWLSVPQIRRLAIAGVVCPFYHPVVRGDPALYDAGAIVLLRTWAVLGGLHVPASARAAFLARYGQTLRTAASGGSASDVIVFDRIGGRIQAPAAPTNATVRCRVPLIALVAGLTTAITNYRAIVQDLRAGWSSEPAEEVGAELAAAMSQQD
jgi:hypothetical protein